MRQPLPGPGVAPSDLIRAGRLDTALRPRILGRAERIRGRSWAAVLIEDGGARIEGAGPAFALAGPAFAWLPWPETGRIHVAPGASGAYLFTGATALRNAVGFRAESCELRDLAEHPVTVAFGDRPERAAPLSAALAAIAGELAGDAPAARMATEAHLRLLLVHLWRARGAAGEERRLRTPAQAIFARFETLVERHFRDRWTVQGYAAALGVSRDRLGDICRRAANLSPRQILDERLLREARLLLDNSTHSVEQIAGILGFPGASNFNRFFRAATGESPGRYRLRAAARPPEGGGDGLRLHEWP